MITSFKDIDGLFTELNGSVRSRADIYIIGGAALLKRGMKPATKDIDLVVSARKEFLDIQRAMEDMGFVPQVSGKGYSHMNLSQIYQRKDFRIDLFEKKVCGKFSLSEGMIRRAERIISLSKVTVYVCSNEDIFLFKTMTEREGDLADCISIASMQSPDWEVILKEVQSQIRQSGQDVWITWVGERLDILMDRGVDIPIISKIDKLRAKYLDGYEKAQRK